MEHTTEHTMEHTMADAHVLPILTTDLMDKDTAEHAVRGHVSMDIPSIAEEPAHASATFMDEATGLAPEAAETSESLSAEAAEAADATEEGRKGSVTLKKRMSARFMKMGGSIQELFGKAFRSERLQQAGRRRQENGTTILSGGTPPNEISAEDGSLEDASEPAEPAAASEECEVAHTEMPAEISKETEKVEDAEHILDPISLLDDDDDKGKEGSA
ncbi:hypothetical protein THASP1DRAFT_30447 [Thamnocephalis sphaerospora]|uniref:Uncharacterized protein n=1 Tax=Thamnocephalis sphaerospora TaxID=78915 RepID=A0A4P9XQH6_9FUNG|nr:hypothetical protein THASP1DRAFT_30447 [Thamnocephalis sphaerospora]|eukprot:RKP07741.1 hypothetical protein THASP1DRAFT_30447 [Thamnocephalis sphaerospora]